MIANRDWRFEVQWRRAARGAAIVATAASLGGTLALHAQSPESILAAEIAASNARILAACPSAHPEDKSALLAEERRIATSLRAPDDWARLGCARALLYAADAIAHEGPLMALGDSWFQGATRALFRVLESRPDDSAAGHLLGQLMLDENMPPGADSAAGLLAASVDHGVRDVAALRGCTALSHAAGRHAVAARCAEAALSAGLDSTWQLLHLAWLRFEVADTTGGVQRFNRALGAARDSSDWGAVGWQLRWFLEPDEEATWDRLPNDARAAWVRDRFASRDVRDGRSPGSRLAEHFARLDTVEANFKVLIPWRELGRFESAATPESRRLPETVAMWWEPGLAAAPAFREFVRWEPRYDDRAVLYMRFGKPDRRIRWTGRDTVITPQKRQALVSGGRPPRSEKAPGILPSEPTNTREVWSYTLDGRQLLLSFESEEFDGSVEATRFVTGVLGSYFCDLNTVRCNLTTRSQMAYSMYYELGTLPEPHPLNPEVLEGVKAADTEYIREATTKDDNSVRVDHPIETVAELARIWDPASGAALAVVPYAVKAGDVERDEDSTGVRATIAVTLRQWDARQGSWQTTDLVRRLLLPASLRRSAYLTGYLVTPSTPGVSAWSLVTQQGSERRGRAWRDHAPPLPGGRLRLSDLILGAASQGQVWTTTSGRPVPLAPLGTFDKAEPVSVYWQARSDVARPGVAITVRLFAVGVRGEKPAIEVGFTTDLKAGINELDRLVGIDRLDKGEYRLEIAMHGQDGAEASRSARLLVR